MLGGIGIGLLSGAKNKKIITIVGAVLIAIGIGGMIAVGSQAASIAMGGELGVDAGKSYFATQYAFLFTMIAGLVLTIFGLVSIQGEKGKRVQQS
jgi:quinol-cytochrome oxidoreductase complex cytochrome b subunit